MVSVARRSNNGSAGDTITLGMRDRQLGEHNRAERRPASHVDRLLAKLADAIFYHPWLFIAPQIFLAALSVWCAVSWLRFDANRNNLVDDQREDRRLYLEYMEEFEAQDEIIVVIESENPEKNRQFAERLGRRLEKEKELFRTVFYKGDLRTMGPKALLFLGLQDLQQLVVNLEKATPFLQRLSTLTNLESIVQLLLDGIKGSRDNDGQGEGFTEALPVITRIIEGAVEAVSRPGVPASPALSAVFNSGPEAEQGLYITLGTNRLYLVTARAISPDHNEEAVRRLRQLIEETKREVPGVNVGSTGEPVLEVEEMEQARRDMRYATLLALALCALLFSLAYGELVRPFKAVVGLVIGLCYTLGFTTLFVGHLNILTLTFLPILIGLAIDFGIHLLSRYEEEIRHHHGVQVALRNTLVRTGKGVLTGALTTSGAFLAMAFVRFRGIQEMGIICGAGLLLSLCAIGTFLPAALRIGSCRDKRGDVRGHPRKRVYLEGLWLNKAGWTVCIAAILTVAATTQIPKVHFNYNLLRLQSRGVPAVIFEQKLMEADDRSVLFCAIIVDSLEKAAELERQLRQLPTVAHVESVASHLLEDHSPKTRWIERVRNLSRSLPLPPDPEPINLDSFHELVRALDIYLGLAVDLVSNQEESELSLNWLRRLKESTRQLRLALAQANRSLVREKLEAYQKALFDDLRQLLSGLREQEPSPRLERRDLPEPFRYRFISRAGNKYLLMVSSKLDLWEKENQERFIADLRTVADQVTGTPVQLYNYTTELKRSYEHAAVYAAVAITVLVWLHFRNLALVGFALLPVGLGMIWLTGWMGFAGLEFNPANIMTLPLVIGVGVTNGIHILHRCREEGGPCVFSRSTGKAVLVSGLTTIFGFGSLMVAKHQGISSLGELMAIGTITCMVCGLVVLPAVLNWLQQSGIRLPRLWQTSRQLRSEDFQAPAVRS